ncbi:MAG TPA: hypothetical protein VMR06_15415 [Dokdonella sp.]|uniref:hypothetical protein n=1 Tax=Dokdonella sp. TaxID=2291710 RepID=UPI002CC2BF06|nr:hypothetical protein [Dokdonella sp.]HUD43381.1 hypothetical protein [Dokdonella sp.]
MRISSKTQAAAALAAILTGVLAGDVCAAIHVNPHGTGQALLLPYYTVNKQQQTYLTVGNTSDRAKMLELQFMEGYNSRTVFDVRLFLAPHDVWTGTVFALDDIAGEDGEGAALLTSDRSCTAPDIWTEGHGMLNGYPYVRFFSGGYAGDGGPQAISRTREGHVQIVELADLTGYLADAVTHRQGVPLDCSRVRNLVAPTTETVPSTGGLFASGAVINVAQGTYFPYRATALAGFPDQVRFNGLDTIIDPLTLTFDYQTDRSNAQVYVDGAIIDVTYEGGLAYQAIDAVSAVLMADMLQNEYLLDPAIGANSDWVVTFPTKQFYTNGLFFPGQSEALPPFVELFGENGSCVRTHVRYLDRESQTVADSGFPGAPPIPTRPSLCYATNVLSFLGTADVEPSPVLGSRLIATGFALDRAFKAGWARLDLDPDAEPHAMRASMSIGGAGASGKVFHGLPAIGFWATNLVNNSVADGVMSNYSGTAPHVTHVACTSGESACD